MMKLNQKFISGFTLVEMAVVLVIFGVLLGGLLVPLSAQRDLKDYSEVRTNLEQIKEALYGFAVVNGRLPCPDTTGDGIDDNCGGSTSAGATTGGNIPWVTLGVQGNDPWGRPYRYRINNAFGGFFSLSTKGTSPNGMLRICTDSTCATVDANNVPAVIYSLGKNGGVTPAVGTNQLENTDNDRDFVSQDLSPTFDDMVVWISPNILFNRMVTAGKLP